MAHPTPRRLGTGVTPRGRGAQCPSLAGLVDWGAGLGTSAWLVGLLLLAAGRPAPAQSSPIAQPPAVFEAGTKSCPENIAKGRNGGELSPIDDALEVGQARLLAACGKYAEAVAHYRRILQDQPQSVNSLSELGETLLRAGRADEAVPAFRQALQFIPNSTVAAQGLARALAATGNYEEA